MGRIAAVIRSHRGIFNHFAARSVVAVVGVDTVAHNQLAHIADSVFEPGGADADTPEEGAVCAENLGRNGVLQTGILLVPSGGTGKHDIGEIEVGGNLEDSLVVIIVAAYKYNVVIERCSVFGPIEARLDTRRLFLGDEVAHGRDTVLVISGAMIDDAPIVRSRIIETSGVHCIRLGCGIVFLGSGAEIGIAANLQSIAV